MNVTEALHTRSSIRQFTDQEIPEELLKRVIDNALQSPSSGNVQPYRIAIATQETKDEIKAELSNKYTKAAKVRRMPLPAKIFHGVTGGILPDGDYNPDVRYPTELKKRKFSCGMGLYETLGIERNDYTARDAQMGRNFEFFDAPCVIFIFIHDTLGLYSALDAGIFMQSLMLAAVEEGLGTCPQAALATWASPIKKHYQIEDNYKLLCGLSIGYPCKHIVNTYKPEKRSLNDLCLPLAKR